ncbi:MAG TPA: hypothetical protein VGM98_08470 [Schlesneria sp.]|jgi:hypothetical protein
MNEFEPVSSSQIERLVDGELSREERRAVLMALDHERDGWRQVALAFLESQALRESLKSRSKLSVTASPMPAMTAQSAQRAGWGLSSVAAIAATAALVFGLGRMSNSDTQQASHVLPSSSAPTTYQPSVPTGVKDGEVLISDTGSSVRQQQTLRLELGDGRGGPTQAVEVPMVENPDLQPEDLLAGPPVIPDSVQRALLRSGRKVYEQRQLYEVTLEDGRQGILPVSNVFVQSAGPDVYQ